MSAPRESKNAVEENQTQANDNPEEQTPEETALSALITGGALDPARRVTRLLVAAGHKAAAITNGRAEAGLVRQAGGLPLFVDPARAGEVRGMLAMSKVNVALHLAPQRFNGLPFRARSYDAAALLAETQALVQAAQAAGVDFIVHTSYAFLYGNTGSSPADESAALTSADDDFIAAAIQAERAVLEGPVPACVLRAGYVYGPDSPDLVSLAETLRLGRPVTAGENPASWVYAEDLAGAVVLAAQSRPAGEVFNIVGDKPVSPDRFLDDFAAAMGLDQPGRLPGFLARARLPRTAATLLDFATRCSNARAREKLGWQPRYADHSAGIEEVLLSWRAQAAVESPS
jgi:nucleoside-diphosphate-sugar epimerase